VIDMRFENPQYVRRTAETLKEFVDLKYGIVAPGKKPSPIGDDNASWSSKN
jgi:hypothetical protein